MTRKRSSPLGLELVVSAMLAFMLLPLLTQAAPFQDATEIQQYTEGCYYNYNHYNEGDRILTNEPCLNCTCHNKMLMCYLRVCPFTKPIGHDCIVEKREDQCCPIITCPEVPVDVAHHAPEPGTELSIPEKYGCSIEEKFYPEGAQVPSNPNKPCELCYCIKNRTSCLMQECTLHIDGCQPIYNKGSCCPVRYNCDHENDVLELEDHSTSTTTTVRPTPGFVLTTTMTPALSADCMHNGERYADGASITGKNDCEHCYCMRGDIVCAVQECDMPMLDRNGKSCRPLPAAEGQCCPSNYVCEDDSATTQIIEVTTQAFVREEEIFATTAAPKKDLHGSVSQEDIKLQEHIDDDVHLSTEEPDKDEESKTDELGSGDFATESDLGVEHTTVAAAVTAQDTLEKKHEAIPAVTEAAIAEAATTLEPSTKIEDKFDQATESIIGLEHSTVSAGKTDEEAALGMDRTTVSTDTTAGEDEKKIEEPAISMDQTTVSADTATKAQEKPTGEVQEKPEELEHTTVSTDTTSDVAKKDEESTMDQTTVSPDTTTDELIKKHEEPVITDTTGAIEKELEQTTVSAGTIEGVDKKDEAPVAELEETTVSTDITGKIDTTDKLPTSTIDQTTVSAVSAGEADKKVEEPATDLDHTTVSAITLGEIDKKQEGPIIAMDQTTASTGTTAKFDKEDALDHTTTSPDTNVDLDTTDKTISEEGITKAPSIEIVDRIDHTTESGTAPERAVTPSEAVTEATEKEPTDKYTTPAPSTKVEDKLDTTTISGESSVSSEDEEIIPVTSAPADVSQESVEETSEEEELLGATTVRPKVTDELKNKPESITEKLPTSEESTEKIVSEITTDKIEMVEEKLESTTLKSETDKEIDEEEVSTEKISTSAEIPETPIQKTPIETAEKATPAPTESITEKSEEGSATTVESPTKEEPKTEATTPSKILVDTTEEEETTSSMEQELDVRPTAKPSSAEELTTLSTLSGSTVQQDEKDIKEATTTRYSETTLASDISATQPAEKATERPVITGEISTENIFEMEKIPAVIPGEGDCLVGQKTYSNNSIIPNPYICQQYCTCISSVVVCPHCDIPQNIENCHIDGSSKDQCCPIFVCDGERIDTTPAPIETSTKAENVPKDVSDETTTPKSIAETATFMPTEIDMPSAITEEPMSHVKDEVEEDQTLGTTNVPKIDVSAFATETPTDMAEKPEKTVPHDKLEDETITEKPFVAHTVVPTLVEKPVSETIEDVTEIDTTAPTAEIDDEESVDEAHTGAPAVAAEKVTETTAPSDVDKEKEMVSQATTSATEIEKEAQTVAPAIPVKEEESGEGTLAPITETEGEAHTIPPLIPTDASTTAPAIKDEDKEGVDETLAHTITPALDEKKDIIDQFLDHTTDTAGDVETATETFAVTAPTSVKDEEKETPVTGDETHTPAPSVEDKKILLDIHTIKPSVEGDKDTEDHTVASKEKETQTSIPLLEDKEKESADETTEEGSLAHTIAPSKEESEEDILAHTAAPTVEDKKEDKEKKPIDKTLATTVAPSDIDTVTPTLSAFDKGAETTEPSSDAVEEDDKTKDQLAHTAPSVEKETDDTTVAPSHAMDAKKPVDGILEPTIAPFVKGEKEDESATKSSLPSVAAEESLSSTVAPDSEEITEIIDHTIAPTVEGEKKILVDETIEHTVAPVSQDEKTAEETTDKSVEDKLKEPVEESTAHSISPAQEDTESSEDIHTTPSSIQGQEKENVTEITSSIPTTKDEEKDHTGAASTESIRDIDEATKTQTDAPTSDDETKSPAEKEQIEDKMQVQTELPSTAVKGKEPTDEILTHTIAPHEDKSDELESEEDTTTAATPSEGAEKSSTEKAETTSESEEEDQVATKSPAVGGEKTEFIGVQTTSLPITDQDKEKETIEKTSTPSSIDESLAHTTESEEEGQVATKVPAVQREKTEPSGIQTTSLPITDQDKKTETIEKTSTPSSIDESLADTTESEGEDQFATKAPTVEGEKTEPSGVQTTSLPITDQDKETETIEKTSTPSSIDESLAHTTESEEEDQVATKAPADESGKKEPSGVQTTSLPITDQDKDKETIEKTSTPSSIDESLAHTTESGEEDQVATKAPAVEGEKTEPSGVQTTSLPITDQDKEKETIEKTSTPSSIDESLAHTTESEEEGQVATKVPAVQREKTEPSGIQTTSLPITDQDKTSTPSSIDESSAHTTESEEEDQVATKAPAVDEDKEKKTIEKTSTPSSIDESLAHTTESGEEDQVATKAPTVEGEKTESSGVQTTSLPITDQDKEKETIEKTSTPSSIDESLAHTTESEDEDQVATKAPAVESDKKEPSGVQTTSLPITDEDKEKKTIEKTSTPSSIDESLAHTTESGEEDQVATKAPAVESDKKEPSGVQTTSLPITDQDKEKKTIEKTSTPASSDESLEHTTASEEEYQVVTKTPTVQSEKPSGEQTTSIPVKDEDKKKETIEMASTPASIDESLEYTTAEDQKVTKSPHTKDKETGDVSKTYTLAPSIKDEEEETTDKYLAHTTVPAVGIEGVTKLPTEAPSIKDEDKKLDESVPHASTPSVEFEKVTEVPAIQDDKESEETEDATKSSVIRTDEDVGQETIDETLPTTAATTSESEEESEEDTKSYTLAPIEEPLAHTDSPVIVAGKTTVSPTIKEDRTAVPITEEEIKIGDTIEDHTAPTVEDEEKAEKESQTTVSKTEDIEAQTSIPSIEVPEKKPIDESLAHTIIPGSEEEKEKTELEKDHTVAPLTEEEEKDAVKLTTISAAGTETSTVVPSIKTEVQKPTDETLAHTVTPVEGIEKETEDISKVSTTAPSIGDKEKETIAPTIEDKKDSDGFTLAPITEIEKETAVPATGDKEKESIDTSFSTTATPSAGDKKEEIEIPDSELHTVAPAVEEDADVIKEDHTLPTAGQKEEEESVDEFLATTLSTPTIAPAIKKDEKETMAHTISPITESETGTVAPSVDLDESLAQTIAPVIEGEQEIHDVIKIPLLGADKKETQTVSPIGESKPLEETTTSAQEIVKAEDATKAPLEEEKVEVAHTIAPIGSEKESDVDAEEHTILPLEDDKTKETDLGVTPSVEDELHVTTVQGEKEIVEATTTSVKDAEKESIDEALAHTIAPEVAGGKTESTESTKEGEGKKPVAHTTATPATESEKETATVASIGGEQITRVPSVVPSLESEEDSGESVESEEELTTEGSGPKIQHIGEFVTERVDEAVTELPHKVDDTIKHDEVEASGEEGEDMEDVEVDVKKIIPSSTPKSIEESETPSSIEGGDEGTTSKGEDQIVESTNKPLESITTESVPLEGDIAVTTPEHKITEAKPTAEVQTEVSASDEVTLSPHAQDIPTKIHTGIGVTEESATEKTESSEESDEQKESDKHKTSTESTATEEAAESDTQTPTTAHPLFGPHSTSTYLPPTFDERIDAAANISETAKGPAAIATTSTTSAPPPTTAQYPQAPPSSVYGGQPPQYPSYPEDEYTDEDETEVFGPGTCRYGGKLFVSAQQIPRDDPCDFCFCFRSDIICLQQSCPPPISGCHEEPINGFCCPRYECPVSMATTLNITTSTTTTSTTLPPHFLHHAYQGAAEKNGCHINGKSYQVGEKIDSTSGPCMHCTCGGDGQMKCDPKTCSPEPMLRQMIAVVASRRR